MNLKTALIALALGLSLAIVTAAPGLKAADRSHYTKEVIRVDDDTQVIVFEDVSRQNTCYITILYSGSTRPSNSCVANH